MIWAIVGAVIIVIGLIIVIVSRRGTPDGVASFQRQIDALSPEARRPVVDRVQRLDEPVPPRSPFGDIVGEPGSLPGRSPSREDGHPDGA